jgi:hypothetical protein
MANGIKPSLVYFCTVKNKETKEWQKSHEYSTMSMLLEKLGSYLENHPNTQVSFQTRTVYI